MLDYLKEIIPNHNNIITDIEDKYLSDALLHNTGRAHVLVKVSDVKQISLILKYANKHHINITTRGSGTNLVGSTIPNDGIIIDMSLLNNIISINEENMNCLVEAGVVLENLQTLLVSKNLFYPPDPGEKKASIGGNIATNAGGMKAIKYGVTRDYVLGLEVVLPNGDIIFCGSENLKDSTGYSLKNYFIGSEGTLGIITKCLLKIQSLPKFHKSIILGFSSLDDALLNINNIIKSNTNPSTLEFIDNDCLKYAQEFSGLRFSNINASAFLLVSYDGNDDVYIDKILQSLPSLLNKNSLIEYEILDDKRYQEVWKIRGLIVSAIENKTYQEPMDIVVPLSSITYLLKEINTIKDKYSIEILSFGHAGDGNIHLCILRNTISLHDWNNIINSILNEIYDIVYECGGLPSAEHGIGISKKKYFYKAINDTNINLMKTIKKSFDPNNILNQNIMFYIKKNNL